MQHLKLVILTAVTLQILCGMALAQYSSTVTSSPASWYVGATGTSSESIHHARGLAAKVKQGEFSSADYKPALLLRRGSVDYMVITGTVKGMVSNSNGLAGYPSPHTIYLNASADQNVDFKGPYTLYVRRWDNGAWTLCFNLTFGNEQGVAPNTLPVVNVNAINGTSVVVGETLRFTSTASDVDGNLYMHSFDVKGPDGKWNWNGGSGSTLVSGGPYSKPATGSASNRDVTVRFDTVGGYTVLFKTKDGLLADWVTSNSLIINVSPVNIAPALPDGSIQALTKPAPGYSVWFTESAPSSATLDASP